MLRKNKLAGMLLCLLLISCTLTAWADSNPFKVVFTVPGGWTNAEIVDITLRIEELTEQSLAKLEYKLGNAWQDITDGYRSTADGRVSIQAGSNAVLKVRMTDSDGQQYTDEKEIECFDREAPKVSAVINGASLDIVTQDTLSSIAGVQVNGLLFTSLDGDGMSIPITDTLEKYERLAIRAFDYAGNFSEPVSMVNTCYEKQPEPTPAPAATSKSKQENTDEPKETTSPEAAAVTDKQISGASSVYVSEKASYPGLYPETVPTPTPVVEKVIETVYETEYITLGPGMPYQSDGNSHTLDMLYSAATNKQFITLQTKSGNTFYLVIDYDKPIDEDAEMYKTYFMNLVDERDLLALLSDDEKEEVPTPTPQIVYVTPEPTVAPVPTAEPVATAAPVEEAPSKSAGVIALVAILAVGGVIAFLFLKKKDNTGKHNLDNDFDMDEDEDSESEA